MTRQLIKILFLLALVVAGSVLLTRYERSRGEQARWEAQEQEKRQLAEQKRQLEEIVVRLSAERRVADVLVVDQVSSEQRVEQTRVLFVEYGRDGAPLPPRFFTIQGNEAHIDALVIKFDREWLAKDDPLRGHSVVLFHRIFGNRQTPDEGQRIDEPGVVPAIYRADPRAAANAFEIDLWQNFWRLADDESYRRDKGVRLANRESPWGPLDADRLYTLTLESDGGLNITSRPIDGIWREFRNALLSKTPPAAPPAS